MSPTKSLFHLLALLLPTLATPDLVTETCTHTIHFSICTSTLNSNPQSTNTNLKGLAAISLNASFAYTEETAAYARTLKYEARHGNETEKWHCLRDCLVCYDEAKYDLEQAKEGLEEGELDTVRVMVSGAMASVYSCEDGFEVGEGVVESPLRERNGYLVKLCSNSLAIARLLG